MKVKIWLLVLMMIGSTNFLNAQAEFPVLDARWCYGGYGDTGEDLGNFCIEPIELVDTNGNTYTKVYFQKHPYAGTEELLYREEDRRFYVIPENQTEEILVYDFNLIVGDTFVTNYGWGTNNDTLTLFVQSVDTVITMDGISRKQITLENNASGNYGAWLEGIGSLEWLFVYPAYVSSVSGGYYFNCHSQGTETIYPVLTTIDCNLIIKTDDLQENVSFEIYPNPVEDVINIDFKNLEVKFLAIINLAGVVVLEKKINSSETELQLFNNLEAGIYFAKVYRNDGVILTKKFIKI